MMGTCSGCSTADVELDENGLCATCAAGAGAGAGTPAEGGDTEGETPA